MFTLSTNYSASAAPMPDDAPVMSMYFAIKPLQNCINFHKTFINTLTTSRIIQTMFNPKQLFADDIKNLWDPSRFGISRAPWHVGEIENGFSKAAQLPCCLDMPVKLCESDAFVLPSPYSLNPAIIEIVTKAIAAEKLVNSNIDDYYAYLTVDVRPIMPGSTHRQSGWHFDGMQSTSYPVKLPVCHSYLYSTCSPTEFATSSFNAEGLDEITDDWFANLGRQVDDSKIYTPPLKSLVGISAYQIHRSPTIKTPCFRTFVRLEFSQKRFNRLGNTINPDLQTDFIYTARLSPFHDGTELNDMSHCKKFNPENIIYTHGLHSEKLAFNADKAIEH